MHWTDKHVTGRVMFYESWERMLHAEELRASGRIDRREYVQLLARGAAIEAWEKSQR